MKNKKINHWILISKVFIYACIFWLLVSIFNLFLTGLIPMREPGAAAILTAVLSGIWVYALAHRIKPKELWEALGSTVIFIVVTVVLDVGTAGKTLSLWKLLHWHYWIQFILYPVALVANLEK